MKPLSAAVLGACTSLLLAAGVATAAGADRLLFRNHGFSIAAPETTELPAQSLMLFLPASEGFAPNVNVQLQPYAGTVEEYVQLSLKQFEAAKLDVTEPKIAGGVATFEYAGTLQGKSLHWYARTFKQGGHIYLATATATEGQWSKVQAALRASVDSFAPHKK